MVELGFEFRRYLEGGVGVVEGGVKEKGSRGAAGVRVVVNGLHSVLSESVHVVGAVISQCRTIRLIQVDDVPVG